MSHPSPSPEFLRELGRVRPGVLTAFVSSGEAIAKVGGILRSVAMSLGMMYEYNVLTTDCIELQWTICVRRTSALDPKNPRYSIVRMGSIGNPLDAGRFLRRKLFDVIDDSPQTIEFYQPEVVEAPSAMSSGAFMEIPDSATEDLDRKFKLSKTTKAFHVDAEAGGESEFEQEKKRWVDALSALIVQYMMRFHEAPPMSLIEESVRGKILLSGNRKSPIVVNGDMKIFLPELNEIQLRMTPLAATVYILFLCHPEGIRLKDIAAYRDELAEIYSMVKPGGDDVIAAASIDEIVNPLGNSLNEKLSMIRRSINRYILDKQMAENYYVSGKRGEPYSIKLGEDMIKLPEVLRRR